MGEQERGNLEYLVWVLNTETNTKEAVIKDSSMQQNFLKLLSLKKVHPILLSQDAWHGSAEHIHVALLGG